MTGRESHAWVNGRLLPRSAAALPVDDFALRYGAACFETMLARYGRVFREAAHLDRLREGLRAMRVTPPAAADLAAAVSATLEANGLRDASVRLTVTAGSGGPPDLSAASDPATVVVADPLPPPAPPARLRIVSVRLDEHRPLAHAKVANFLPYLLARAEAREAGADDAVLLNHAGRVAEGATANLFVLLDGTLLTPPLADGPLPGITRAAMIEVAQAAGIPVEERSLRPVDLAEAQGMVLTSSVQGLRPVASVEGGADGDRLAWTAPAAETPAFATIRRAYEVLVERECRPTR